MRISKINLYQVSLPMIEGAYSWSNQSFEAFDSTVVHIETDEGFYGVGEICPLGPADLPPSTNMQPTPLQQVAL